MAALTSDRILQAAQAGETDDWEFKSAAGGLPSSFWDTYSAMANTDGGVIVLGVSERDGNFRVDGLGARQIAAYKKTLHDGLNNRNTISHNLVSADRLVEIDMGDTMLLAVHVPVATRTQRPVHRGLNPFGSRFRRAHEGDYRLTDEQVRHMIADADPNAGDLRILEGYSIEDLDPASLRAYRNVFGSINVNHYWLTLDDTDFLEQLGGWRRERRGQTGLTVAGLLMFGKTVSIQAPEGMPAYFVDFRERLDADKRWTDRLVPDGRWEANLFQFYSLAWPRITRDLKVPFRLEGKQRVDETEVHVALREAFVNALVHSDYSVGGGVVVERQRDRFVVENPGTLLVSMDQLRRGGVSECRNKALQKMFRLIGGGEQAGSGFHRIQAGWNAQHWRAPSLTTQTAPDRIILALPMVSLVPEEVTEALEERFGGAFRTLGKVEMLALATAVVEGEVTNARMQDLTNDHPDVIRQVLQALCASDFLGASGKGRWTRYRLAGGRTGGLFEPLDDSSHKPADSTHSGGDSTHSEADSSHPEALWEELTGIAAAVAASKRASAVKVRGTIKALCRQRFLTLDQLARLLARNGPGLRERHLTAMVQSGELLLRFPGAPNHPDQAYRSDE